jgi:anti-anti-sigma factor
MTASDGKALAPSHPTRPAAPHLNGHRAPMPQRQAVVALPGEIDIANDGQVQHRLTAPSSDPARRDGLLRITPLVDTAGFRIDGEVDLNSHAELAAALAKWTHSSADIVVDLAGAEFVDVGGLRLLVRTACGLPSGQVLVLRRVPPILRRLLEITNWAATPGLRVEPLPSRPARAARMTIKPAR